MSPQQKDQPPSAALATTAGMTALEPSNIAEGMQLAAVAARAKLFGVLSPDDAFVRMATGMGLGLSAWQSLRGLFVISGKVGIASDLMLALCLSSPDCEYFRCTETTAERATFKAKRRGGEETVLSFTMAEAKTANLTSNPMYAKYPSNMLRARAIAFLARLTFPERMHGILTREEIDGIEAERDRGAITVESETTGDRSAIPSPVPADPLALALAAWAKHDATDEQIATIAASADPKHRAWVLHYRIQCAAEDGDAGALDAIESDASKDPHEQMRSAVLVSLDRARQQVGAPARQAPP